MPRRKPKPSRRGKYDRSMTAKERESDQRIKLLDAATQVIAGVGFTESTVEAIIARAGMSRRTFYEHFSDLRDVLGQVYDRAAEISLTMVLSSSRAPVEPFEGLRAALAAWFHAVATYPEVARVMFQEYRLGGPEFAARYERDSARYAELLFEHLTAAHVKGQLARAPTLTSAYVLAKGIEAVSIRAIARGEQSTLPELVPEMFTLITASYR
ncbi:MAG: TetR/AcrR family transcriptional regulator [Kofleriaceae bacterium]